MIVKRLAAILGSGPIVEEVFPKFSALGGNVQFLGLAQNSEALLAMAPDMRLIKPLKLGAALDILASLKIEAVVFAGSAGHVSDFLRRKMGSPDAVMLSYVKKAGFFSPPQCYLRSIKLALEDKGIEVLSIADIFEDVSIPAGFLVGNHDRKALQRAIAVASAQLHQQPMFYVRQSHIIGMETGAIIGRETTGTDILIRKFESRGDSGEQAVLIKLPLEPYTKVDAPVIGSKTVEGCMRAGIKGIVVKARETIVLQKGRIIELCQGTDFFVYAFD